MRVGKLIAAAAFLLACSLGLVWPTLTRSITPVVYGAERPDRDDRNDTRLDKDLAKVLREHGFTGKIQSQFDRRLRATLHRGINDDLADLGRKLWFDTIHSLHHDNTCGGCHSPTNGFGDTQSIAIGVDNNGKVGPNRAGPRNQRRSPLIINTALYPKLMWNGRFSANSGDSGLGDPFKNTFGFHFPLPEGNVKFPANDPIIKHLLQAQAFIPPTELVEVGGFTGTCPPDVNGHPVPSEGIAPEQCMFDNGIGETVPLPDPIDHFRNEPIRQLGLDLLNANRKYRQLFGALFPDVAHGGPIDFSMFGRAIAEFEFTLVFADAPIDQFARGQTNAMTAAEKRGALVFFDKDKGNCVVCHAVSGKSNEMFSDFDNHVVGVPQIAPFFGLGKSNMVYDGLPADGRPGRDEDFGLEQFTGHLNDRYKFRTAPLRNLAVSPAFFHNGAFTDLEDAIRHHLNPYRSARRYNAKAAGVDRDLTYRLGPIEPVLAKLDPILKAGIHLTEPEIKDLVKFVKYGLLDQRATKENLCKLVPKSLPSRMPVLNFEECHR